MNLKNFSKKLIKNKKGQGMVEYILLLVVVVGVVLIFKKSIMETVGEKLGSLKSDVMGVTKD